MEDVPNPDLACVDKDFVHFTEERLQGFFLSGK